MNELINDPHFLLPFHPDCPNSQLQSTYTMYPGSGLSGSYEYYWVGNLEQCQSKCNAISDCQHFEIFATVCYASRERKHVDFNMAGQCYLRDCA
ncbi:hypothetical protein ACOMHN_062998 [Nucella lapillus]